MKLYLCHHIFYYLIVKLLLINLLFIPAVAAATDSILKVDYKAAIKSLLTEAKTYYDAQQYEQAAALLERALRIDPRNPILWYNLGGVRLAQKDWKRAAYLAQKSNTLAGNEDDYRMLRVRNWVVITQACEGMKDKGCTREARNRAQALLQTMDKNR
jgi:tetratricopeptide (TPR) repeat protein